MLENSVSFIDMLPQSLIILTAFIPLCLLIPEEFRKNPSNRLGSLESSPRLPRHMWPIRYDVKLKPMFVEPYTIEGSVNIEMSCVESAHNITIHINDITVLNLRVLNAKGEEMGIKSIEEDDEKDFLVVSLETPVEGGETYSMHIDFHGVLNSGLNGFYRSTYIDENGKERLIGSTQFSALGARKAFPCFDEPEFKARFKTVLCRMANMSSVSNMDIEKIEPLNEDESWFCDYYHETVNMSTYLLAFVISDYKQRISDFQASWNYSIYGRREAIDNGDADYAGTIGPKILSHYEHLYEIPYVLPKLDMGAIYDFAAGAMENWGLILYRETAIFYDPHVSGAHSKRRVAEVVGHELAHMWFGNLVTCRWWTDLWLNEGFANYIEYIGVDHVEPTWRVLEEIVLEEYQFVMQMDSLESSNPIMFDPDSGIQSSTGITYSKGASIIRMMEHFLTEDTFLRALINYLNAFAYSNVQQDDLWEELTKQAHSDRTLPDSMTVKEVMDTWTWQKGYPVISVERSTDGISAVVRQKRFLMANDLETENNQSYSWWVPISYTNAKSKDFSKINAKPSVWLKEGQKTMTIENVAEIADDWVIFNLLEAGYYRVNYDERNWKLITTQLNEKHEVLPPVQRSQLIDDSFNLARGQELDYSVPITMAKYLKQEQDYYPMAAFLKAFDYIELMFVRTSAYGYLTEYINQIVNPHYEAISFDIFENIDTNYPDITKTYTKRIAVEQACYYGNTDCIEHVKSFFNEFQQNYDVNNPDDPENQISPDIKSVVYCTTLRHGSDDQWEFLWHHYLLTRVAAEKDAILKVLGCSSKTWILNRYLEELLSDDGSIRSQDSSMAFESVANNPIGRPIAWDFIRARYIDLKERYGSVSSFASSVAKGFNTQFDLQQMEEFNDQIKGGLEGSIAAIKRNVQWMNLNYDIITQLL